MTRNLETAQGRQRVPGLKCLGTNNPDSLLDLSPSLTQNEPAPPNGSNRNQDVFMLECLTHYYLNLHSPPLIATLEVQVGQDESIKPENLLQIGHCVTWPKDG